MAISNLARRLREKLFLQLEKPSNRYERRVYNNMDKLYRHARKGDVVLMEGRSRISRIIKLFTQSHWSHVAFYVGDELIQPGVSARDQTVARHGRDAGHMVVEAHSVKGVVAVPLSKYKDYNLRLCRPFGIQPEDLMHVVREVIENLGKHYDSQNIVDIARMLIPMSINPFKNNSIKSCLGQCDEFQVICSGMIAKAFQRIGYPIVPAFLESQRAQQDFNRSPYGAKLVMRHYSQILPRDFDLSPNFEIIKFNFIETGHFDYKSMWAEKIAP
jgi:Permuted papain-like amidase enzyme, YaeF/YiiX, C92 family